MEKIDSDTDRSSSSKVIVSNVNLAFLDHLKPKIFFCQSTMVADTECPFSKSLDLPLYLKMLLVFFLRTDSIF